MPMRMLDVSKHQSTFNPMVAKNAGIDTTILRVAYSKGKDSKWDTFAPAVKSSGMEYGAYGFSTAHYTRNAANLSQAKTALRNEIDYWVQICKASGYTVLAIDQELESGNGMALGKVDNTALMQYGVGLIRSAGLTPLIYASASWIRSYMNWQNIDCDFWVAYYPNSTAAADFTAYSDGTFPSGTYGDLLRSLLTANKLAAWQYGSTSWGSKYGAGSANIDRNWQYKSLMEVKEMEFKPVTNKKLVVTSEKSPACQCFKTPDVNDSNYQNLSLGEYDVSEMSTEEFTLGGMTGPWVKLASNGYYCIVLSDRCRLEDKPVEPSGDLTAVMESLARIESALGVLPTLEANLNTANSKLDKVINAMKAMGNSINS